MIKIRLGNKEDAIKIAKLHKEFINQGFLSSLGISFLKLMYQSIINSKHSFCIVAEEDEND